MLIGTRGIRFFWLLGIILLLGTAVGAGVVLNQPATGTVIKIHLMYEENGKKKEVTAREWVRYSQKNKELDQDWVFGGSYLIPDPLDNTKKPYYAANDGDVICVSNFDTALLDLPIESSVQNDDLAFEAYTERIPAKDTAVLVILEPLAKKK